MTGITFEFVYTLNGRNEDQGLEDFTTCEETYWNPLASFFSATHVQRMDPTLKSAVLQCMDDRGHPGDSTGANLAAISPVIGDDETTRVTARECTVQEAQRLYPELPSVTVRD